MAGKSSSKKMRPATSLEGRENQLISLAFDLAEKLIREDRASSQVITHFLKLGSTREKLEQQKLMKENLLLSAKIDALASAKKIEELYAAALNAMRTYAGRDSGDDYDID